DSSDSQCHITVFEKERIFGGRLRSVHLAFGGTGAGTEELSSEQRELHDSDEAFQADSDQLESDVAAWSDEKRASSGWFDAGGSIIVSDNRFLKKLADTAKVTLLSESEFAKKVVGRQGATVITSAAGEVFRDSTWSWISAIKAAWRYGPLNMYRLISRVNDVVRDFSSMCDRLEQGECYDSVEALMGPSLFQLTQRCFVDALLECTHSTDAKSNDFDQLPLVLKELVECAVRCNYTQSQLTMNAFGGFIGLTPLALGSESTLLAKTFASIPRRLLRQFRDDPDTTLEAQLDNEVSHIELLADGVRLTHSGGSDVFDHVVLCAPLSTAQLRDITGIVDCTETRTFRRVFVNFVDGTLKEHSQRDVNEILFCDKFDIRTEETREDAPCIVHGLGTKLVHDSETRRICKFFTTPCPATQEVLDSLFESVHWHRVVAFDAYPRFVCPETFLPFDLTSLMPTPYEDQIHKRRVLYANTIEHSASAMEMSCVAARNCANLLLRHWAQT
ncbi:MAG: hypothetical protein MHM6MM_005446, partial [Cercozoa sp. M6MM]